MKVYFIPGLGFDHRIFKNISLDNVDVEYLDWIEPVKNESIADYANRLSKGIDKKDRTIILGHSLGGIIAQEMAEILPVDKIILISSIKSRKEMPFQFRVVKPLFIHKLFSKELTAKTIKYWGKSHDYETIEEQNLVADMVNKQSNHYLQWALRQLSIWKHPNAETNIDTDTEIIQIHGDLDKTFPIKLIRQPFKEIKNTGHFMVFKKAEIISEIINAALQSKSV